MAREIEEIERAGTDRIHKNRGSKQQIQTRTLLHVYHHNHNIKHLTFHTRRTGTGSSTVQILTQFRNV